jgi:hypothetical protein
MDSSSLSSMSFATTPDAKLAPIVVAGEAAYIGKARFARGVMGGATSWAVNRFPERKKVSLAHYYFIYGNI